MGNALVESMAEKFVGEVRDQTLRARWPDFLGTWAVVQNNAIYKGLVERLDESQKDLLWKLLSDTVEQAVDAALEFVNHKHATNEMRVTLYDPETGESAVPLDATGAESLDLRNEFWFNWLEQYARVRDRPRTHRREVGRDLLPRALLAAVTEDFPGAEILSQEQEVRASDGEVLLYHLLLTGRDAPIAFLPSGGRARVT
jgi:hypothetical protein